ncbi:MAG: LysR family transcriptional regulator [Rubrivivax sp.]|nr:LysR family transcriptional regulator [Rubrivivax sp.]
MPHTASSAVLFSRLMAKSRLRHLQLLVAVADEGNLRRAAADVGLSQPAATQALSELEELLEVELFERHAKGMRLTMAGTALIPVIRHALEALQASTESLAALREGVSGLLRLGVITAVTSAVLGERVLAFCARHPAMRVELVEDSAVHLLQELQAGTLNMVLCRRPNPVPARLHFERVRADEACVIAGPGHPLARRRGLRLEDAAGYCWMRPPRVVWIREIFDDFFENAGITPKLHPVSTASLGPLPEILRDNQTLALCPATLARTLVRWQLVVTLDLDVGAPTGEIGLLCPQESLEDPVSREFIDALRVVEPQPAIAVPSVKLNA